MKRRERNDEMTNIGEPAVTVSHISLEFEVRKNSYDLLFLIQFVKNYLLKNKTQTAHKNDLIIVSLYLEKISENPRKF